MSFEAPDDDLLQAPTKTPTKMPATEPAGFVAPEEEVQSSFPLGMVAQEALLETGKTIGKVGMGALETLNAPFQVAGEAIRGASESEPLRVATAEDPSGFRAPSIVQRIAPSLRTQKPPADPFQKAYQGLEGIANLPRGLKAASDVVTGEPDLAAQIGGAGLALGLMPPKGPKTAAFAEEKVGASSIPKDAPEAPFGSAPKEPPIGGMPPPPKPPPVTPPPLDPIQEAQKYIGQGYENFAKQPGAKAQIADYMQEKSQMWAIKEAGGSPLMVYQAQKVGKTPIQINTELRAIGQYLLDKEIVKPELGTNQMMATHAKLLNEAGEKIGNVRRAADKADIPMKPLPASVEEIIPNLGKKYKPGKDGYAQYEEALEILKDAEPTFEGQAKAITQLNAEANKANRNWQPHTPFTDVANEASRINNERIKQIVPDLAADYEQGLREFGINKKIEKMLGRKVGTGIKRMHVGGIGGNAAQMFMDEAGYKAGARITNRMATNIKRDPSIANNLPSLFKEFINEVEDVLPDNSPSMAHGGIVGEVGAHLESKYGAA